MGDLEKAHFFPTSFKIIWPKKGGEMKGKSKGLSPFQSESIKIDEDISGFVFFIFIFIYFSLRENYC